MNQEKFEVEQVEQPNSWAAVNGMFISIKMNGPVFWTGTLMGEMCYFLEFAQDVLAYYAHPLKIEMDLDGRRVVCIPQFRVAFPDSTLLLLCRWSYRMGKEAIQREITVARTWAERNGHEFQVLTEENIRGGHQLDNLQRLSKYDSQYPTRALYDATVDYMLANLGGVTFEELSAYLGAVDKDHTIAPLYPSWYDTSFPMAYAPYVYNLIFHHILDADMDQPFTPAPVCT
jgi:hypothetical protein